LEIEIVVKKKGQTTIPAKIRQKFKIEEGTRLKLIETDEGILLKPRKSIWDMIGAFADKATAEEITAQWYKLRHENETVWI